MATRTSETSGVWSLATNWVDDAKPAPGDDVIIADGTVMDLDENVNIKTLTAAGNTGYITCSTERTLTLTGTTTGITYGGTLTAGFIRLASGAILSIVGPGSGSLLKCTSTGYIIVTAGTSALTITNTGATAIENTAAGRTISYASSGTLSITGAISTSDGRGLSLTSGATGAKTITGNIIASGGYGIYSTHTTTTITINGVPTSSAAGVAIQLAGSGMITWTGSRTLTQTQNCFIIVSNGTLNLTNLALTLSGVLVIQAYGSTVTLTNASIVKRTVNALAAGLGVDLSSIISGPNYRNIFSSIIR